MATDGANEDREPLKFFPDVGDTVKDDTLRRFSDPIGAQYQRSDARDAIESFLRARAGELKSGDLDVREESADGGANTLRIRYSQYLNDLPILAGAGVAAQQARPRRRWPIRCPTLYLDQRAPAAAFRRERLRFRAVCAWLWGLVRPAASVPATASPRRGPRHRNVNDDRGPIPTRQFRGATGPPRMASLRLGHSRANVFFDGSVNVPASNARPQLDCSRLPNISRLAPTRLTCRTSASHCVSNH
jgi:hypothetical protein